MHYQINLKIIFKTAFYLSLMLPVNAQDLLITSKGKRLSGKFLDFNKKDGNVQFKLEKSANPSNIPTSSIDSIYVVKDNKYGIINLSSGEFVTLEKINYTKKQCEEQRQKSVIILDFKNDYYGAKESFADTFREETCYQIEKNYYVYEVLRENGADLNNLSTYDLIEVTEKSPVKFRDVQYLFIGHAHKISEPYRSLAYTPNIAKNKSSKGLVGALEDLSNAYEKESVDYKNNLAALLSGTMVYYSVWMIDVETKEKYPYVLNKYLLKFN